MKELYQSLLVLNYVSAMNSMQWRVCSRGDNLQAIVLYGVSVRFEFMWHRAEADLWLLSILWRLR